MEDEIHPPAPPDQRTRLERWGYFFTALAALLAAIKGLVEIFFG
jgi:hypothetical protein